jgi:hypothetical protein
LSHWEAKGRYLLGDYKTALELADEQVEALDKEYPALVMKEKYTEGLPALKEGSTPLINDINVPDYVIYIYMKFRLLQARVNKAIGMNHVAHEICNAIIMFRRKFMHMTPAKWWISACKAAEVLST